MAAETNPNEANPNEAEVNVPSTSDPNPTDEATANAPDSATIADEPAKKPAAKRPPKAAATDGEAGDKPAAKAKKEKPPALEDKPFAEFIQQDFLPALKAGLEKQGIPGIDLKFEKRKINIIGFAQAPECWQVFGHWDSSYKQPREFSLYFFDENINGQKGFSCVETGGKASTLESFRIDERKADLGLLVFWTLQRLNAQKWLVRN